MSILAKLYHFPMACSGVTLVALEAVDLAYELELVDLSAGDHHKEAFRTLNPRGKVPALLLDGRLLTENVAILFELDRRSGGCLRGGTAAQAVNSFLGDLAWCGATLHPMVRQIRAPVRFTDGDPEPVRDHGLRHFEIVAQTLEERLSGRWWYGSEWSIVDSYLRWIVGVAATAFNLDPYPGLREHSQRVDERPASQRAREREAEAVRYGRWLR
jgi:glutathione S-transferase